MVGIIQIGSHAFADRYTYIPLTGIFIILVWGTGDILKATMLVKKEKGDSGEGHPEPQAVVRLDWEQSGVGYCVSASIKADDPPASPVFVGGLVMGIVVYFILVSYHQTGYWRDAETLFRRAAAISRNNALALNNLGAALSRQGRYLEALEEFQKALALKPNYAEALFNTGSALSALDKYEDAITYYLKALELQPHLPEVHNNIAIAYAQIGHDQAARLHFQEAIRLRPGYTDAVGNLKLLTESKRWH
ncbi:MAG: tetratricopeptide repeat protein [Syntrophales bacterium]|nr:tetratricopeptide repeat protein [Syntrophales bacterium]